MAVAADPGEKTEAKDAKDAKVRHGDVGAGVS